MKRLLIGLMTASLLLAGTTTLARGNHDNGRHHGSRPPAHQGYHRPHHRPQYYRPHRRHHHRDGYRGAYLLGGVALGAILADSFASRDPEVIYVEPNPYPRTRIVYRDRPVTTALVSEPEWRLLRDQSNNCFEVTVDENGNELRTQVPASECDW